MKIAILHFAAPPVIGGVESVMGHHARLFAEQGHQVSILAGRGSQTDPRIHFKEIPLIDSRHPAILELKKELDEGRVPGDFKTLEADIYNELSESLQGFDVLFVHNVFTMAKNLCLTSALRKIATEHEHLKVIAWHHDLAATSERYQNELYPKWPWNLMNEGWEDVSIKHVAVSKMRLRELHEVMGIEPESVTVIPSGVDCNRLLKIDPQSQALFSTLKVWQNFPRLLLPVRITRRKNIELALKVTSELSKTFPQLALVITGPPGAHNAENQNYFNELLAMRDSLGLNKIDGARAIFLAEISSDFLPDAVIADFYKIADALLMTSSEEGFGIPIIEAALSRIPIFCSDLEPFKEIAGEVLNYFSLDEDPKSIAQNIAARFQSDSTHGLRQQIYVDYSWDSVFEQSIQPLLEK
jgi:glycosyltransferase involved in cell wall biosynthesis